MQQRSQASHGKPVTEHGAVFAPDLHDIRHLWLKAVLLVLWVAFSFGVCFYARELQTWVRGWHLGYWMAAQGAVLMFMVIVLVYCWAMDRFERNDMQRHRHTTVHSSQGSATASTRRHTASHE